jgi:hypothetical protein
MFDDVNPDGFVDRNDFYYNSGLDAANCMYKRQYPPDPNTSYFSELIKRIKKLFSK